MCGEDAGEPERNATLVRRAVEEIWQQGNLAVADALFGAFYINHGGLITDLVCGPEAIKIGVAFYRLAFPCLHITIGSLIAQGEIVELRWTARAAAPDELVDPEQSDRHGSLGGTTICRVVYGQIVESWTTWDSQGLLRRLGIVLH